MRIWTALLLVMLPAAPALGDMDYDIRALNVDPNGTITGVNAQGYVEPALGQYGDGLDFGFDLSNGDLSAPARFWVERKPGLRVVEFGSLVSVNVILRSIYGKGTEAAHVGCSPIRAARIFLSTPFIRKGHTAVPLNYREAAQIDSVVSRLRHAGLDGGQAALLVKLNAENTDVIDREKRQWTSVWYEVDRTGGIERVTLRGSWYPVRVDSVLREAVLEAGTLDPALMEWENWVIEAAR